MNMKAVVSIFMVIILVLIALAVLYGQNLYQMFLRVHGMG
jgi:hypothetical protein